MPSNETAVPVMSQSGNNLSHSVLSASASARWNACPASGYWSETMPSDTPGSAAREGTGLHSLFEIALNTYKDADEFDTVPMPTEEGLIVNELITDEQRGILQTALDYTRYVANGSLVQTEKRYYYGQELGVADEYAYGTGDVTVIERNDLGGYVLHIMDLKTGRVPVPAERNTQLALYAAGALRENELTYEFDEVVLHIIQPRVSGGTHSWRTTPAEIRQMTTEMQPSARKVVDLVQEGSIGGKDFKPAADCYNPTDNCTFCKAAAMPCPAQAKLANDTLLKLFEEAELGGTVPVKTADEMKEYELGDVLKMADILEPFFGAVREEAMRRAVTGAAVKGYKIVRSRAGRKSWKESVDVINELAKKVPGVNFLKPAEPKTVSEVLKMDVFKAKRGDNVEDKEHKAELTAWLAELYVQSEDACSLVPESDPRDAWVPIAADANDFEDLT